MKTSLKMFLVILVIVAILVASTTLFEDGSFIINPLSIKGCLPLAICNL